MTVSETKIYAVCPHCSERASAVCHLKAGEKAGAWRCKSCGGWYQPAANKDGSGYLVKKLDRPKDHRTLVFLRRGDVLLVVHRLAEVAHGCTTYEGKLDQSGQAYFYNEHTCPTNYLSDVVAVVDLKTNDPDPHGVFEFEGAIEAKGAHDEDTAKRFVENNWQSLWAQAKQNAGVLTS